MTRKDYRLIAEALRDARHGDSHRDRPDCSDQFERVVDTLVNAFEADNERFDRGLFYAAVGLPIKITLR
jgi:hypothetical protein